MAYLKNKIWITEMNFDFFWLYKLCWNLTALHIFKIDSIIQTQSQIFYPIIISNHLTVHTLLHLNAHVKIEFISITTPLNHQIIQNEDHRMKTYENGLWCHNRIDLVVGSLPSSRITNLRLNSFSFSNNLFNFLNKYFVTFTLNPELALKNTTSAENNIIFKLIY